VAIEAVEHEVDRVVAACSFDQAKVGVKITARAGGVLVKPDDVCGSVGTDGEIGGRPTKELARRSSAHRGGNVGVIALSRDNHRDGGDEMQTAIRVGLL